MFKNSYINIKQNLVYDYFSWHLASYVRLRYVICYVMAIFLSMLIWIAQLYDLATHDDSKCAIENIRWVGSSYREIFKEGKRELEKE